MWWSKPLNSATTLLVGQAPLVRFHGSMCAHSKQAGESAGRRPGGLPHIALRFCLMSAALVLAACSQYPTGGNVRLHTDMVDQPSFRPQREPRTLPVGSVPKAEAALQPSLAEGTKLFNIYCAPCHGESGHGNGVIAAKISKPADLASAKYAAKPDEFFPQVILNGSGLMPPQYENLSETERRSIVLHIRRLQSQ